MCFRSISAKVRKKINAVPLQGSNYWPIFRKERRIALSLQKKAKYSMFGSIEFYVVAVFVAAAVIGLAAMPRTKGEARTFLYAGELAPDSTPSEAGIVARVDDRGRLEIYRYGLEAHIDGGSLQPRRENHRLRRDHRGAAYSRATQRRGRRHRLREHRLPGVGAVPHTVPQRGHGRSAAFSINIRPGNEVKRLLS